MEEKTVRLFNFKTNQAEDVPEASVQEAIATGNYGFKRNEKIPVVSPEGIPGTVDSEEAFDAIDQGYNYETSDKIENRLKEKKFGDQNIRTFAESAASAATFGVSDQVLTKVLGVPKEELQARREVNPIPDAIGDVAGILGPAIVSSGGSLAAKGVSAGVKGAAKAGQISEKVTEKLIKKALKSSGNPSLAKKILEKGASKVTGSAVEGAAYGMGQLISEEALGTADFNAENLVSSVGVGAILGGAVGAGFAGIETLAPVTKRVSSGIGKKIKNGLKRYSNEKEAAADLAGITKHKYATLEEVNPKLLDDNLDFLRENLKLTESSTEDLAALYTRKNIESSKKIHSTLKKLNEVAKRNNITIPRKDLYDDILQSIDGHILEFKNSPGYGSFVKQLKDLKVDYRVLSNKETPVNILELQKLRKDADGLINFNKKNQDRPLVQQASTSIRKMLRNKIDETAEIISKTSPESSSLANDLKKANRDFFVTSALKRGVGDRARKDPFLSVTGRDIIFGGIGFGTAGPAGLALAASKKFVESDLRRKLVILNSIEKASKKNEKLLKLSVDKFYNAPKKSAKPIFIRPLIESHFSKDEKGKKPANKKEAFKNVSRNLRNLEVDLDTRSKRALAGTRRIAQSAPKTAVAAQNVASLGLDFLLSKLPRKPSFGTMLEAISKEEYVPSDIELSKFSKYMTAVEDPNALLKELSEDRVSRETVEAVKMVYPTYFAKIQDSIMEGLSKNPDSLTYPKRIQLGILMELPTDPSLLSENIMGLQQSFSQEGENQQDVSPAVKSTVGGLKEISIADRANTDLEAVQKRS